MKNYEFKSVELSDKDTIVSFLRNDCSYCLASFTFASLISWQKIYSSKWVINNNVLQIKFTNLTDNNEHLMQPLGNFTEQLQENLISYANALEYPLTIFGVSDDFILKYPEFVSHFEKAQYRDMDNYIYLTQDLAELKGNNYQPKRNLIKQFESTYEWTLEELNIENLNDCQEILNNIYYKDGKELDPSLQGELSALNVALSNFTYLEQKGTLIKVNNKPIAFSIYEYLNCNTAVVHYEKADKDFKGLYQLINRETAKKIMELGCKYINREEDLGIEGLRKAKMSYHPIKLCPSNALIFKK